jgi:protein KRI1
VYSSSSEDEEDEEKPKQGKAKERPLYLKDVNARHLLEEELEKICAIAGIDGDAACKLGADDLEEDFDPDDYDRKMQEMFNDSYYEADDVDPEFVSGEEMDLDKPDFDKEDELLGLPKGWALDESKEGSSATDEKTAKAKKISLKDKVELENEMEEYYKLDYEDTIGDLKTRFKYKQVQPNSFGLSMHEILQSDDRDLNQYVSMKKLAPYRENEWKVTHHKKLEKDMILGGQKKEGKVKTGKKSKSEEGPISSEPEKQLPSEQEEIGAKKKSTRSERRKRQKEELKISTDRRWAYGDMSSKRHKSH